MKTKTGVVPDIESAEITPSSGVDVKDTQMLTGLGELPAGHNATNVQTPYETGSQPRGPKTAGM
jgi:hypothetical protein